MDGGGGVVESFDGIEVAEAGGGGKIDCGAAGGEEFGGLGVAVAETGGDERRLGNGGAASEEKFHQGLLDTGLARMNAGGD